MFGIRYIKSQPTVHLMQFKGGKLVREGAGASFFYYAPTTPWWRCQWRAAIVRSFSSLRRRTFRASPCKGKSRSGFRTHARPQG